MADKIFSIEADDGLARAGILKTAHGEIKTPAFIPVATKASVKSLTPEMILATGAQAVLGNTYHLYLEPGEKRVEKAGGLGKFMNWHRPTFTDSGGFQVFSLGAAFGEKVSKVAKGEIAENFQIFNETAKLAKVDEDGVTFRSHIDGSEHRFTPEKSMEIQWALGADIIFTFDECTSPLASYEYQKEAMERTHRWAARCLEKHSELKANSKKQQALFAVVQGGQVEELRRESARTLAALGPAQNQTEGFGSGFAGFGIGGSFTKKDIATAVSWAVEELPADSPKHLLGIGEPEDMILAIGVGIDTFDCVTPTRNGRNGTLYTKLGKINITNEKYRDDMSPLESDCSCYTCRNFSRAYLAHLYRSREMLAGTLGSIHNIYFLTNLCQKAREAILEKRFKNFAEEFLSSYKSN